MGETLGYRLRELRIAKPYLRLSEAAALLDSTPQWLSKIENDRLKPTPDALAGLANVYGVDVAELIPLWERWEQAPPPDLSDSICSGRRINDGL